MDECHGGGQGGWIDGWTGSWQDREEKEEEKTALSVNKQWSRCLTEYEHQPARYHIAS